MTSRAATEMDEDTQEFLLREWNQAHHRHMNSESRRLSIRAVDKVAAEFKLRGFTGFLAYTGPDGNLIIEGVSR